MASLEILTEEDVHQIAYLTQHGWELLGGRWQKDGFTLEYEEWGESVSTTEWPRDRAYWAQKEQHDET